MTYCAFILKGRLSTTTLYVCMCVCYMYIHVYVCVVVLVHVQQHSSFLHMDVCE